MSKMPDVSIVIPVHNRSDLLASALRSCAESAPRLGLQVIVVDDASTEDLAGVLAGFPAECVRLDANSGSSVARNQGLARALGRYVKFLDSDDVLLPGALQREHEAALRTGADIVVSGWCETRIDSQGRELLLASMPPPRFASIPDDLLAGRAAPTSGALYSAAIAGQVSWDPLLAKLNDWDYFIGAALCASHIVSLDGAAYRWRDHAGTRITSSSSLMDNALEFYAILGKLESRLRERGLMTPARCRRLAQYLYKELRGLYRYRRAERHAVLAEIYQLDPDFFPADEERSRLFRWLARVMPLRWLLAGYGIARSEAWRRAKVHA
jgi:glycosyltransferase involved in cell wall biosynthesis